MTKSLHRHCTFKTILERRQRRSGFSAEMQRRAEKAQNWRAVADYSRQEQRRPGRLDHRRWRVEFGGQSVMKTRSSAVAVEPRDRLVGRVRRWGTAVPNHAGICIRGVPISVSRVSSAVLTRDKNEILYALQNVSRLPASELRRLAERSWATLEWLCV